MTFVLRKLLNVILQKPVSNKSVIFRVVARELWIGLHAPTLPGYYVWVTGHAVGTYNKLEDMSEPCVLVNSSGGWLTRSCDQKLQAVCEYTPNGKGTFKW